MISLRCHGRRPCCLMVTVIASLWFLFDFVLHCWSLLPVHSSIFAIVINLQEIIDPFINPGDHLRWQGLKGEQARCGESLQLCDDEFMDRCRGEQCRDLNLSSFKAELQICRTKLQLIHFTSIFDGLDLWILRAWSEV